MLRFFRLMSCSSGRAKASSAAVLAGAAGVLFLSGIVPVLAADFPTVVANILLSQTDGRISTLDPARKQQMVAWVDGVLVRLPNGKKRFVVEGATFDEQENRFGKVVKENRAEWEQKIASACGKIAMGGGGIGHQ
jgi:hypothetical protein